MSCDKFLNYVLTDYGYCFTFNLEGFPALFNENSISDDFKSYQRTHIARSFERSNPLYNELIDDSKDPIQWNLEKGYNVSDILSRPHRALRPINRFYAVINETDKSNMCPSTGDYFSLFYHMPNEILTPFHRPEYFRVNTLKLIYMKATKYSTSDDLRKFPPKNRGCYFEGEKELKFFKSYTKAQCQFECLANETLKACGCVKFSMPRNNSTPICDLDKVSCYLHVMKKLTSRMSTCNCLHSCTYISYSIEDQLTKKPTFEGTAMSNIRPLGG